MKPENALKLQKLQEEMWLLRGRIGEVEGGLTRGQREIYERLDRIEKMIGQAIQNLKEINNEI